MTLMGIIVASCLLFFGGFWISKSFTQGNRTQFQLAGLAMLGGVVICVLLVEYQLIDVWYVFAALSIPTSIGYQIASRQSIHR